LNGLKNNTANSKNKILYYFVFLKYYIEINGIQLYEYYINTLQRITLKITLFIKEAQ